MTDNTKNPLRIVIVGHVDHGKSTLIGRLLHDTDNLLPGKIVEIEEAAALRGVAFEWSFVLDAFQDERDQAITIDTTQIRFQHAGRDYIIIDAPGHQEFLRNMVSGAASADAAVLVVDAEEGIREQTRRHAYLINLLGLKQVAVVVNKMDRVRYDRDAFEKVRRDVIGYFADFGVTPSAILPATARDGEGLIRAGDNTPWYDGPGLMGALTAFERQPEPIARPLRFSVQDVYRTGDGERIVVGRVESGILREGDEIVVMPTGARTKIRKFATWPDDAPAIREVRAGDVAGFVASDPLFFVTGQIVSHTETPPTLSQVFNARMFWLGDQPLAQGQSLEARFTTERVPMTLQSINRVIDTNDLSQGEGATSIPRNGVAEVTFRTMKPVPVDQFIDNERTGRVALSADRINIHGGGIISLAGIVPKSKHITPASNYVPAALRAEKYGHRGAVFWLTGLYGSGKSTLATRTLEALIREGINAMVLDGDTIRHGLNRDLGFSAEDRRESVRRIGETAAIIANAGIVAIAASVSPYRTGRDLARQAAKGNFHEIYIKADLNACEQRDTKGLYEKARGGLIKEFTGIDAPYETPVDPELIVDTQAHTADICVAGIVTYIAQQVKLSAATNDIVVAANHHRNPASIP